MCRRGRSRCRCCAMAPTPSPLTNTTSLVAESLTTSADHLPETTSTAAQIAAHATRSPPSRSGGGTRLTPSLQRNCFSLWRSEMGNDSFYYTAADKWVLVAVLGSKRTKRRPGPPRRYCRGGRHHRARSRSIVRPRSGRREATFIAAASARFSETIFDQRKKQMFLTKLMLLFEVTAKLQEDKPAQAGLTSNLLKSWSSPRT
jgi:hypothetical protein